MNKHKRHYCVLALFVAAELIARYAVFAGSKHNSFMEIAHALLYGLYNLVKGYQLVPFFQKKYPELYEKYPYIRLELTAAGFAWILSEAGEEMDEVLKDEAREIRITRIILLAVIALWLFS